MQKSTGKETDSISLNLPSRSFFCHWMCITQLYVSIIMRNKYCLLLFTITIVMLTIRGRLITPFVLGSMTVGLNILIRHSFMDL